MSQQIKLRRDLAANWTAANTLLSQGEQGFETDTKKIKIGDGVTTWNSLPYWTFGLSFATVATSGSYNDLTNKPTIPSSFSQLTNGSYAVKLNSSGTVTIGNQTSGRGYYYTLPSTDGASGQVLVTDGSGGVTWQNIGAGSGTVFAVLYSPTQGLTTTQQSNARANIGATSIDDIFAYATMIG